MEGLKAKDGLELSEELQRGIAAYGVPEHELTFLQRRAIARLAEGKDLVVHAGGGRGKTIAMVVGILQRIAAQGKDSVQVLLVLPTRELAQGTDHIVRSLGAHMDIRTQLIVGGVQQARNYKQMLRELASVQVVVSTPGRMLDAIIRGGMDPEQVRMLVLDEADETMSRGFEEVVDDMIKVLPRDIQIAMFTCTMHPECTRVAQEYMSQHVYIQHKPVQS